jgi:hypothetical protein
MVWGQVFGTIAGGLLGNKAAKNEQKANKYAIDMQLRPYLNAEKYIKGMYQGGTDAINQALANGYYSGKTYAELSPEQKQVIDSQIGFGKNLMNTGSQFGQNYANLFNQATNNNAVGDAMNYATANSQPLIDAAMRGANRNLNEVALPNLNLGASGTGNTRNSRAGIAEAVLRRGNAELEADTTARINNQLMNTALGQSNRDFSNAIMANQGLSGSFNTGLSNALAGGSAYQTDLQNTYNDQKTNYEGDRDFALDQWMKYNSGILGQAPQSTGTVRPNLTDPTAAALSGAYAGWGFGGKLQNSFPNLFGGFGGGGGSGGGSPMGYNPYAGYTAQDRAFPLAL